MTSSSQTAPCNGHPELCDRTLDQVVFPTTHNSFCNAEEGWLGPNQLKSMDQQLADGVRGFMLDTHREDDAVILSHGTSLLGSEPLVDGLARFASFLEDHPREVVVFILESYVDLADTEQAMEESGLLAYVHAQPPDAPWPTLGAMIEDNRRLVVLADDGGGADWYHDVWAHAWETHWSYDDPEDMPCDGNRGSTDNPLFILNHFISDPLANEEAAALVNQADHLGARARRCMEASGRLPNFVTVDFYSLGDLLQVVDELNGVASPPG